MNSDDDKKIKEEDLGKDDTNREDDLIADENTSSEEAFKDTGVKDASANMDADATIEPVDGRSNDQISIKPLGAIPKVGSVGSSNGRRVSFGKAILKNGNKNLKKKDSNLLKNPRGEPNLMPVNNDALTAKDEAGTTGWVENTDQTSPRPASTISKSVERCVSLDINTIDTVAVPSAEILETEAKHYSVRPQIRSLGTGKLQQEVRKRSSEKKPIKSDYGVFNTAYQAKAELEALCLWEGGGMVVIG